MELDTEEVAGSNPVVPRDSCITCSAHSWEPEFDRVIAQELAQHQVEMKLLFAGFAPAMHGPIAGCFGV
jgi:hypothetical protein